MDQQCRSVLSRSCDNSQFADCWPGVNEVIDLAISLSLGETPVILLSFALDLYGSMIKVEPPICPCLLRVNKEDNLSPVHHTLSLYLKP